MPLVYVAYYDIHLIATNISGVANMTADCLSRCQMQSFFIFNHRLHRIQHTYHHRYYRSYLHQARIRHHLTFISCSPTWASYLNALIIPHSCTTVHPILSVNCIHLYPPMNPHCFYILHTWVEGCMPFHHQSLFISHLKFTRRHGAAYLFQLPVYISSTTNP